MDAIQHLDFTLFFNCFW